MSTPPGEYDTKHKVRVMFGNGVRPQIWEDFQNRFNVPRIAEFYGATEGNANISKCIIKFVILYNQYISMFFRHSRLIFEYY